MNQNNDNNIIDPIIKTSLEYYDENQLKIDKIYSNIKYILIVDNKNFPNEIHLLDKDKNLILKSKYETIGFYIPKSKNWKWAWAVSRLNNNSTAQSKKLLSYALDLDFRKNYLVKSLLINSNVMMKNNIQLDIHLALYSYKCKKKMIFKYYIHYYSPVDINVNSKLYDYSQIINSPDIDDFIITYLSIIEYDD